jgi:hypothetical protein
VFDPEDGPSCLRRHSGPCFQSPVYRDLVVPIGPVPTVPSSFDLKARCGVCRAGFGITSAGMTLILALNPAEDGSRPEDQDVAKALVMAGVGRIVEDGGAVLITLQSGVLELRLLSGEIFHLGETTVTRIA